MNKDKKIIIGPYVNYDGILSSDERKRILKKIESAFSWLGAEIPEVIEIRDVKYNLNQEIQNLILKKELTQDENQRIKKLISALESEEKSLTNSIKTGDISDHKAMELLTIICGILRAVQDLRELLNKASRSESEVNSAKKELLNKVEDTKRWLDYVEKIK